MSTKLCNNCHNELVTSYRYEDIWKVEVNQCPNCKQKQEIYDYNIDRIELEPVIDISYLQNILWQKINALEELD
jgi:Zn-finger nucleic acid-binding protein